jgi:hypothetical protein
MLNDTLTIGLVLVLLFGSVVLYLYTCIQQSEQKISLLESILLDLKMSTEIKSYTELPMDSAPLLTAKDNSYMPFEDESDAEMPVVNSPAVEEHTVKDVSTGNEEQTIDIDEYKSVIADAVEPSEVNYESMSLKELQALAKTRNIVGVTKKGPLIEALKTSDRISPSAPSSAGSNSFLETSASVSDESA